MLSIPFVDEVAGERLRAHSPKRAGRRNVGPVKDGQTIGSLRATGGPPGGVLEIAASLAGSAASVVGGSVPLLELPVGGRSLVESLKAPARDVNPLLVGSAHPARDSAAPPPPMRVLQRRVALLRHRLDQIDNRGRFLKASRNLQHENAWFRVLTYPTRVDALG